MFLLSQGLIVPAFGRKRETRKLAAATSCARSTRPTSEQTKSPRCCARSTSGSSRRWHGGSRTLPAMECARPSSSSRPGSRILAHRLVLLSVMLACVAAIIGRSASRHGGRRCWRLALVGIALPFSTISQRSQDALREVRGAAAGCHRRDETRAARRSPLQRRPASSSPRTWSEPIAREFELTFADINYGNDVRRALLGLLLRVPSVNR